MRSTSLVKAKGQQAVAVASEGPAVRLSTDQAIALLHRMASVLQPAMTIAEALGRDRLDRAF